MSRRFLLIMICAGVLLTAAPLAAMASQSGTHTAADMLVELGIDLYHQGRYDEAAHEFSKALMISDTHPEAKHYLAMLGLHEGLYSGSQTRQRQVIDLSRSMKEHQARIARLDQEKLILGQRFDILSDEYEALFNLLSASSLESDQLQRLLNHTVTKQDRHHQEIAQIQYFYIDQNELLADEVGIQHQRLIDQHIENERLSTLLGKKQGMTQDVLAKFDEMIQLQDRLINLQLKHQSLQEVSLRQQTELDYSYEVMDDFLYIREARMDDLANEVIAREMDLCKAQIELVDRIDQIAQMLGQRALQEKQLDETRQKLLDTLPR